MGIPSYYKKLIDKIKGLVSKTKPIADIKSIYFDFNCLIYYCAKRPNTALKPYPEGGILGWEDALIHDIVRYTVKVVNEAGCSNVFLALDGVVPMAKIRQQRLRRFKAAWLAKQENTEEAKWDTNCITPGTEFMARLGTALERLCSQRPGWTVSTTEEPGEGEHKIMNLLRNENIKKDDPIIIYGMDADLILLTMLNKNGNNAYLMREDSEMGSNALGEESYSYFSIDILKHTFNLETKDDVRNYVATMSLLGNDFIPHSLGIKIKENGHLFVLNELKEMKKLGINILANSDANPNRYIIQEEALSWLLKRWSSDEKDKIFHSLIKKSKQRFRHDTPLENKPLEWAVERQFLSLQSDTLNNTWIKYYEKEWLYCLSEDDIKKCCSEYRKGLQWVIDYYTGNPVNMFWYFPYYLPPLWGSLLKYNTMDSIIHLDIHLVINLEPTIHLNIIPKEQLAMVLPLESWHLLVGDSKLSSLPSKLPMYWPDKFSFFSVGKCWLWECESVLPILQIDRLRSCVKLIK